MMLLFLILVGYLIYRLYMDYEGRDRRWFPAPGGSYSRPCPHCGAPVSDSFKYCPYCKGLLRETCAHCGREIRAGWKVCPYCGHETSPGAHATHSDRGPHDTNV